MKLWILEPRKDLTFENSPWEPCFGKVHLLVIVSDNEESARKLADKYSGSETTCYFHPWLNKEFSDCREVSNFEKEEVLTCYRHI